MGGQMFLLPVPMSTDEFLNLLDVIRASVEKSDSFEGNLTWEIPTDVADADFDVTARFRVGNSEGQGGMIVVGEWREFKQDDD